MSLPALAAGSAGALQQCCFAAVELLLCSCATAVLLASAATFLQQKLPQSTEQAVALTLLQMLARWPPWENQHSHELSPHELRS